VREDSGGERAYHDLAVGEFIERLASSDPVPGGGSASAVAASLAAALVSMVAGLSVDRPRYADHSGLLAEARAAGLRLSARCLELAAEDATAYAAFAAALKMPRETDQEASARRVAMQAAARHAAEVPMTCVETCLEVAAYAEALAGRSNVNASSDVVVAALLAEAAAHGAGQNVLVNLPSTGDGAFEGGMTARLDGLLDEIERLSARVREVVGSGATRGPLPGPRDG
jgi:formiminotetrahydrofolate cyclodeaminase